VQKVEAHEQVTTGKPMQSGVSCAMVLRLPSRSPVIGFVATVIGSSPI
jgi:hypothetical protein